MKSEKLKTQMPVNQASLTPVSFFAKYCQDNGLKIDESTLEELHKYRLVYPALKIYLGAVEFKKIYANFNGEKTWRYIQPTDLKKFKTIKLDGKKYYSVGSLGKFNDRWLDYYFDNDMVEWPAQHKFSTWKQKRLDDFCTNTKDINKQYQFLYDKKQLLAIKIALPYLRWVAEYKNTTDKQGVIIFVQNKIANLYKFFEIYHDMEKLYKSLEKMKREEFLQFKKIQGHRPSKIEWSQEYDFDIFPAFKKRAEKILKSHKLPIEFTYEWREFIAGTSLINESSRSSKIKNAYIKSLDDSYIVSLEDTHYMIYIINSFLYFLTRKEETVKQILTGSVYKICPICKSNFHPRNKEQITCGSSICVKEHKNKLKRNKRKIAKIS